MDEQTYLYADEMMCQYKNNNNNRSVMIASGLKRLKVSVKQFAFDILREDMHIEPTHNGGLLSKISVVTRRTGRKLLRWMIQKLLLVVKKLRGR